MKIVYVNHFCQKVELYSCVVTLCLNIIALKVIIKTLYKYVFAITKVC